MYHYFKKNQIIIKKNQNVFCYQQMQVDSVVLNICKYVNNNVLTNKNSFVLKTLYYKKNANNCKPLLAVVPVGGCLKQKHNLLDSKATGILADGSNFGNTQRSSRDNNWMNNAKHKVHFNNNQKHQISKKHQPLKSRNLVGNNNKKYESNTICPRNYPKLTYIQRPQDQINSVENRDQKAQQLLGKMSYECLSHVGYNDYQKIYNSCAPDMNAMVKLFPVQKQNVINCKLTFDAKKKIEERLHELRVESGKDLNNVVISSVSKFNSNLDKFTIEAENSIAILDINNKPKNNETVFEEENRYTKVLKVSQDSKGQKVSNGAKNTTENTPDFWPEKAKNIFKNEIASAGGKIISRITDYILWPFSKIKIPGGKKNDGNDNTIDTYYNKKSFNQIDLLYSK